MRPVAPSLLGILVLLACTLPSAIRSAQVPQNSHSLKAPAAALSSLHNPLHAFNVAAASLHPSLKSVEGHQASPQFDVQPRVLSSSDDWFTVTWRGVQDPDYDDLLALYVPGDADITESAPAKFMFCAQASPGHVTSGSGSARFHLINYRQDMAFVLLKGGLATPVAVAKTPTIQVLNPNQPLQGHLARTSSPTEMVVQWTTRDSTQPQVRWGPHQPHTSTVRPEDLPHTTPAATTTYYREDMCGGVARTTGWMDPGAQHSAVLTGLLPGQRYDYAFGDPSSGGWSRVYSFLAAPGPDATVHILAIADLGQADEDGSMVPLETNMPSLNTTRRMQADMEGAPANHGWDYSLLLHEGDLSYAEGFSATWDNFFHQLEPLTTRLPYMVSAGNHERDWPGSPADKWGVEDSGGECGIPYQRRLAMPSPAAAPPPSTAAAIAALHQPSTLRPGAPHRKAGPFALSRPHPRPDSDPASPTDQPWYAFDHGPIHFLHYSTEHDFEPGSPQHAFLLRDLQSVDRRITPWLIVAGHRPIYISSTNLAPAGDQYVASRIRASLESLFREYKVDLTLSGHHHSYQRTCAVYNGTCTDTHQDVTQGQGQQEGQGQGQGQEEGQGSGWGTVHMVIGHGGAPLSLNEQAPPPSFLRAHRSWWGYLRLHVSRKELHAQVVSDHDGSLMDEFRLTKGEGWGEECMAERERGKGRGAAW